MNLYCLFDRMSQEYLPVFQAHNDLVATREFRNVAANNAPGNTVASNTEDYDLYQVGSRDTRTGVITPLKEPLFVTAGLQIIRGQENS